MKAQLISLLLFVAPFMLQTLMLVRPGSPESSPAATETTKEVDRPATPAQPAPAAKPAPSATPKKTTLAPATVPPSIVRP